MTLTRAQAARLVTLAAAWDNREVGEAAAIAWCDSGNRARWTYAEAVEAIKDHYAATSDWIMPSHITTRIREVRQDQAMRQQAQELTGPVDPRVVTFVESMAAQFQIPAKFMPSSANQALRVKCPFCGASEGQSCKRPSHGGPKSVSPHPSRVELAEVPE
jgi:hypothetical protein